MAGGVERVRTYLHHEDRRRLDRYAAHKIVRRLAKAAEIAKPISAHSFRHGMVTLALNTGVSLRDVQDAARHADTTATAQRSTGTRRTPSQRSRLSQLRPY